MTSYASILDGDTQAIVVESDSSGPRLLENARLTVAGNTIRLDAVGYSHRVHSLRRTDCDDGWVIELTAPR